MPGDGETHEFAVTRELIDGLGGKVSAFAEGLSPEERAVFATVVAAGMEALGSEVSAFGFEKQMQIESWSFGGVPVQTYAFKQGFPTKWAGPPIN